MQQVTAIEQLCKRARQVARWSVAVRRAAVANLEANCCTVAPFASRSLASSRLLVSSLLLPSPLFSPLTRELEDEREEAKSRR